MVFIDRDGVLNVRFHDELDPKKNYVGSWEDFYWIKGAGEAVAKLLDHGYVVCVVSNQAGIGKGVCNYFEVDHTFQEMCRVIKRHCKCVDPTLWYTFCPHTAEDRCECRKPKGGMITSQLVDLFARAEDSWMIGDSITDMQAGWKADIRKLIKLPSLENPAYPKYDYAALSEILPVTTSAGVTIGKLGDAVDLIIRWDTQFGEDGI